MFDFSKITPEEEKAAIAKFKEYGKGVVMGKYTASLADDNSAKWADLIDPTKWSTQALKTKMLDVARQINSTCNDPILGDLTVAFTLRDHKNKEVKFTYLEMYTFLRGAWNFRKESEDYKKKSKEATELRKFLDENKSTEDKLKEAAAKLAILEPQLA